VVFELRPISRQEAYGLEADYWRSVNDTRRAELAEEIRARLDGDAEVHSPPGAGAEDAWARRNQRRLSLIEKKYTKGLSPAEEAELARLQADLAEHLRTEAPLPFDALRSLEALAEAASTDPQP
jgi:hypothetical protein